jgi:hypothetical protein
MKIIVPLFATLVFLGCEKKQPVYVPPTAEEAFKDAEADYSTYSDSGRFVPIHASENIAILDTKYGNVYYFELSNQKWVKIISPMATTNYQKINPFDLIPAGDEKVYPKKQAKQIDFVPEK